MSDKVSILVADKLASEGLDYLNSFADVSVDVKTGLSEEELAEIVGQYDGLIVRSGVQVTAKVLAHPGRMKAVARAGVGVDNIDLEAATAKGVLVMNSADASTITTAEHAFALMMALVRNIGPAYKTMLDGGWDRSKFVGRQLAGKTLALIGFGRIGQTVAERALAFNMKVIAFDPVYNAETGLDGRVRLYRDVDEMLGEADIISFHCPLNEHTRNMLNADRFSRCRDGVMVVNAARGGVIDLDALLAALDSGKCAGAAIDVYESEPLAEDSPLREHPKILTTPHLGASTKEAQMAVSRDACAQLLEYLKGEGLRGAVNAPGVRLDLDPLQLRLVDLAQRMARLIAPMCQQGIDDVTVTLRGHNLSGAASTVERMAAVGLLHDQVDPPVNVVNVRLILEERGIRLKTTLVDEPADAPRIVLDISSGGENRRVVGSVYADGQPRLLEINGYRMDMIPAGSMLMLLNEDRPGMVGLVGQTLGGAQVNIADMAISRRGNTAMMLLKLDARPGSEMIEALRKAPGILKTATVSLPPLEQDQQD
jgi:D-3-phosphoglycerate dehydrogenase